MTRNAQIKFYFPHWQDACDANQWHMARGRFTATRDPKFGHAETNRLYNQVWDAAETIARQQARALVADDLRHACHIVALGKDYSSHQLTVAQTNRVVRLFDILKDPDNIAAVNAYLHPELDVRRDLVRWIRNLAPEAYILELAQMFSAFQYPFWEDLPEDNLRSLARLIRKRIADRHAPITQTAPPEMATADAQPYQPPVDLSKTYKSF